jgi:hypothetical protein
MNLPGSVDLTGQTDAAVFSFRRRSVHGGAVGLEAAAPHIFIAHTRRATACVLAATWK